MMPLLYRTLIVAGKTGGSCLLRRRLRLLAVLILGAAITGAAQTGAHPKLVVGIVIDQFRYDYLTRFRADYHGGLDMLLKKGAVFTNAHYQHSPTVTAIGHSIFMSGAMPAVSGIIQNSWYDRQAGKQVTSVCDWTVSTVGAPQAAEGDKCTDEDPASPRRLLVSTIGDELRNAHDQSKVIGISLKARAAILPSGHRANGAYWFDNRTGNFVSSSFYMKELPAWAQQFNSQKLADKYVHQAWPGFPSWNFAATGNAAAFSKIPAGPWGNELIARFAEAAIENEKLGQRSNETDLLTVSFSSNDYVGHAVGPDAPEVRDMALRVDALIGDLLKQIDRTVGLNNVLVVLTADHGAAPAPPVNQSRHMPGAYITANAVPIVQEALSKQLGSAQWTVAGNSEDGVYLNWKTIADRTKDGKAIDPKQVYEIARQAILNAPELHAIRVYDREQLQNGIAGDFVARSFVYGFFPKESPDLEIAFEPYAVPGSGRGTGHFSPYSYDTHVPVIFMGQGIRGGRYPQEIMPNDIAPTLATMLDIETPSGSTGRVLNEILQQ